MQFQSLFLFQEGYNFFIFISKSSFRIHLHNTFFDAKILCLYFLKFLDMMVHSLCHRKKSGTNLLLKPRRNQKTTLHWRKFIVLTSHRDAPISTKTFTACTERYLTYKYINELFSESYLLYLRSVSSHKGAKFYLNSENTYIFYASNLLKILRKKNLLII